MKTLQKTFYFFFLLISVLFVVRAKNTPYVVNPSVSSDSGLTLLTFPTGVNNLIKILKEETPEKGNLSLEIYELDDPTIENAIVDLAKDKDANFSLIYDDFISKDKNPSDREQFIENHEQKFCIDNNFECYPSSTAYNLTHTKTFLIYGKLAIIMTANLIDDASKTVNQTWNSSRDFALCTSDKNVITSIQSIFDCDMSTSDQHIKESPNNICSNIVLSPVNSYEQIKNLISQANSSIDIYMESFSQTDILDELAKKAEEGIKVRALVQDAFVFGTSWNEIRAYEFYNKYKNNKNVLNNFDIRLCHIDDTLYIHAKAIQVDEKSFYIGSVNISNNSMKEDREIGIIYTDKTIAQAIKKQFDADWNYFTETPNSYYDFNPNHQLLPYKGYQPRDPRKKDK